jgi:hypothetical protein
MNGIPRKAIMNKKFILLALAAASVVASILPVRAMAEDVPLHLSPKPVGTKTFHGENIAVLTTVFGNVTCNKWSGTAEFTSNTSGTLQLTFGSGSTPKLEFHLVTVEDSATHATGPGILVTPNAGTLGSFSCATANTTLSGTGLIGTITKPKCGEENPEVTIQFSASSSAVQTHKTVVGTTTDYALSAASGPMALDASGTITLGTKHKLECT